MPELPEVETVRRGLEPVMVGATLRDVELRRPDLRYPFPEGFAEGLRGRKIVALGRRAKYLLADLCDDNVLVMHLGMSGSFRVSADPDAPLPAVVKRNVFKKETHDHVVLHLSTGAHVIYNDPRRFGLMTLAPRKELEDHVLFAGLGMEPTGNELNAAPLAHALRGRRTSLKAALLDQGVIAGLGNIYACEALHLARLSPRRLATTVSGASGRPGMRAQRLADAIRETIAAAIEAGGSSLRDYVGADGELGLFQHSFRVYDRAGHSCPTPGCQGTIQRIVQSGRATYFCPTCQR